MRRLNTTISMLLFLVLSTAALAIPPVQDVDLPTTPSVWQFPKEQQVFPLLKQAEIEKMINTHDKKLLIINFWSTSCAPCLEELPFFQKTHETYRERGVQFVGCNTDYDLHADNWEKIAHAAADRLKLTFPQYGIDADPNESNPYFSPDWMGEQPATFYYIAGGKKVGEHLGEMDHETLVKQIERYLALATNGASNLALEEKTRDIMAKILIVDRLKLTDTKELRRELGADDAKLQLLAQTLARAFEIEFTSEETAQWATAGDVITAVKSKIKK